MNRFSSRFIDTKRYKTKEVMLVVVRSRVKDLVKANQAETYYKSICPFHKEKTASFHIFYNRFLEGWGYKCLGCGRSGDVFTFLMEFTRYEFWEILSYLKKDFIPRSLPQTTSSLKYIQLEIPFPAILEQLTY